MTSSSGSDGIPALRSTGAYGGSARESCPGSGPPRRPATDRAHGASRRTGGRSATDDPGERRSRVDGRIATPLSPCEGVGGSWCWAGPGRARPRWRGSLPPLSACLTWSWTRCTSARSSARCRCPLLRERTSAAIAGDRWVTDGNKSAVRDLVWPRADTVVWLDYPLAVSLWRLGKRALWRTSVIKAEAAGTSGEGLVAPAAPLGREGGAHGAPVPRRPAARVPPDVRRAAEPAPGGRAPPVAAGHPPLAGARRSRDSHRGPSP